METTCFFCENLLSDFVEESLPAFRHEEVRRHLAECVQCRDREGRLRRFLKLSESISLPALAPETLLHIAEASTSHWNRKISWRRVAWGATAMSCAAAAAVGVFIAFPGVNPLTRWWNGNDEVQFLRYYPLQQGAQEILEAQAAWLHTRENLRGSMWEEGGLSPEEFEKTFQVRKKEFSPDDPHDAPAPSLINE